MELSSGFLDNELSSVETEDLISHLGTCADCRRYLEGLKGTQMIYRRISNRRTPPPPSILFIRKVMEAVAGGSAGMAKVPVLEDHPVRKLKGHIWKVFRERPAIAWTAVASAAAVALLLTLTLHEGKSALRPVYELEAKVDESHYERSVKLEHYVSEYALKAAENPFTGPTEAIRFVDLDQ